jgi:hypothetical protein
MRREGGGRGRDKGRRDRGESEREKREEVEGKGREGGRRRVASAPGPFLLEGLVHDATWG